MLQDSYGRKIDYLRLSVTDRCDLRCAYCLPKGHLGFEEPSNWLNFDEIETLVSVFSRLGVSKLRITGGEPLLRSRLPDLVARLSAIPGIEDLSLSTNATQLQRQADELKAAGLSRINVSLDSLNPAKLATIVGRDSFDKIMAGLMCAKEAGFSPIKINMVVMPGVNENEIDEMILFCAENGFALRLIEPMPMGDTARDVGSFDLRPVKARLIQKFGLFPAAKIGAGPAHYLKSPDHRILLGFISPLSESFCSSCNRIRLSVDGMLYLCLGQENKVDLRFLMRQGISGEDLAEVIRKAVQRKPERHEFVEAPQKIMRFMSYTGG